MTIAPIMRGGVTVPPDKDWIAQRAVDAQRPAALDPPHRYSKKALFEAMTEIEYEIFEATEARQGKKDRRVFREATELNEIDGSFPQFLGLMKQVYGEDRTAELLASARL